MPTLYVAGDVTSDQYVYITGADAPPVNLREAWVHAAQVLSRTIPGAAGGVRSALLSLPRPFAQSASPFAEDEVVFLGSPKQPAPLSIFLLHARQEEGGTKPRWSVGRSIVTGQDAARRDMLGFLQSGGKVPELEAGTPLVLVDFNQGWREGHEKHLPRLLQGRPALIRTDDPSAATWSRLRKELAGGEWIWFSPLQDLAGGSLRAPGTWRELRERLVEHLCRDATLWDGKTWLQDIVLQLESDGVLLLSRGGERLGELYIVPQSQAGSLQREGVGSVLGSGVLMVTSLAQALVHSLAPGQASRRRELLAEAARLGLQRLRTLIRTGYRSHESLEESPGHLFPAALLQPPEPRPEPILKWEPRGADYATAEKLVTGTEEEFRERTVLRLGALVTADETYAGALLGLLSRLEGHLTRGKKVLSFSVFGGPGSGKSFVAGQLAAVLDPKNEKFEKVTCNLSQFDRPERLTEVFREIARVGLRQRIPLVIFDEFDSALQGQARGWLSHFLMPMQDAAFFDGAEVRPLPERCVFVFVGGTFANGMAFKQWALDQEEGSRMKGRDFHSRLDRSLDIPDLELRQSEQGSPRLSEEDPARLRRAILLRLWFQKDFKKVKQIEKGVLAWLLQVPLAHGTRSLEGILKASELGRTEVFRAHHLPSREMLQLHLREELPPGDFIRRYMEDAGPDESTRLLSFAFR